MSTDVTTHRHGVTLEVEPLNGGPGFRPRCQTPGCTWAGTLTDDLAAADKEADDHTERWEIEFATTPFPGRKGWRLTRRGVAERRRLQGTPA